jgi:hypothetical protein
MVVISQTKGGVGKSTVAMQVLAPYLYRRHKKPINYIEIDDENKDSNTFDRTRIVNKSILSTIKLSELDELVLMDSEHEVIVDVGGNKITREVLKELKKVGTFDNIKWVIPIGDGELDAKNALKTFELISAVDEKAEENTIFVLSRAVSLDQEYLEEQFINFFGHQYLDSTNAIINKIKNAQYIAVQNDKIITTARYIGSTIWEMAELDIDFSEKVLEAKKTGDLAAARRYLFFRRIQSEAKTFSSNVLDKIFIDLDNWMAG